MLFAQNTHNYDRLDHVNIQLRYFHLKSGLSIFLILTPETKKSVDEIILAQSTFENEASESPLITISS